jgi:iron complex outermembrane receptor protein
VKLRTLIGADFQDRPWRYLITTAQNLTPNFVDVDRPTYDYVLSGAPMVLNNNTSKTTSYGGYVQTQGSVLKDRLQLILGYRLDGTTQESTSLTLPQPVKYTPPNVVTPRYAILYRPIESVSLYATYGESFRFETSGRPIFGTDRRLDPTTGVLYEAGAKSRFFEGRLHVDLEVFELTREGIVVGDPDHPGFVLQTGLERSKGYAVSFNTDPLPGRLTVFGGYGYTDGKVVRDLSPALVGKPLRGTPKHSYTLFAKYRVTTGRLKGLGYGAGVQYSDVQYGPTNQNFHAPAYTIVSAQLNYAWRNYSLNLAANNLFDKVYWRPGGNNGNRSGDPLNVRGSIRARF